MSARMMILATIFGLSGSLSGCGGDDVPEEGGPLGGSLTVTGQVVDFQSGAAIEMGTSVSTSGLLPSPKVTAQGSTFTIEEIPENSAFQILASAVPSHRATFSTSVVVTNMDLADVKAPAVSETFLASLSTGFGVSPTAAKGVLFVRLVDAAGAPKAGVSADNLVLAGTMGPKFLDENMMPAPNATVSSSSGWVVFFEVAPGLATLGIAATATVTIDMAVSPINAGAVTLVQAKVTDGAQVLPTNVLFATQIFPIFSLRGCDACHSGGGIGKDLGNLTLDGSTNLVYKELVTERPTRVVIATPEQSTVLTMPSRETPADRHPNITFAGPSDPDYLKILVWIREGAKDN